MRTVQGAPCEAKQAPVWTHPFVNDCQFTKFAKIREKMGTPKSQRLQNHIYIYDIYIYIYTQYILSKSIMWVVAVYERWELMDSIHSSFGESRGASNVSASGAYPLAMSP